MQDAHGVGRSRSFRDTVQPLVRTTAIQGGSVADVARALRDTYGRGYRRADMLADIRRHRESARSVAIAGYRDMRRFIAHAGVAAFSLSLLLPTVVPTVLRPDGHVLVAATVDARTVAVAAERVGLPNSRELVVTPTPAPTPEPTAAPTPTPIPRPVAVAGGPGVLVVASWYGPGFFENRLPCWPWLQANNLPIQFLPDTWGVAHKTLPCGTMLRLTYRGTTITVPVVDRGPYIAGRELDFSPRVKAALGCTDLCTVLMQIP